MGALAVNQLLVNSQDKGVELTLETAPLENQVQSALKSCHSCANLTNLAETSLFHRLCWTLLTR